MILLKRLLNHAILSSKANLFSYVHTSCYEDVLLRSILLRQEHAAPANQAGMLYAIVMRAYNLRNSYLGLKIS